MTVGEAISELVKYDESLELLILPEGVEKDDDNNLLFSAGGLAVFDGKELQYLGDVQFIEEVYEDVGFDLDDMDDDELDIEFDEENLN